MKILIIGAGNVGLGIGSCLLKAGQGIDFLARKDTASALKEKGLKRTGIFGDHLALPETFNVFTSFDDLPACQYDYLLVCTKSFNSREVAEDLSNHKSILNEKTKFVLFQNGWGNAEIFSASFPEEQIYNARVITGFCRPQMHHVHITVHADAIHIGSLYGNDLKAVAELARMVNNGGIPCKVNDDIEKDLWAKMLYNCALNPLGAIFNVPYGALGESEHSRKIMKAIVGEIFQIMKKGGYKTHWTNADAYLKTFYERLLPPTAAHESSMLQDIKAGKKTEIDAMNGAVINLGEELNIETPHNLCIVNMIRFLEAIKEVGA